jgi:tetratricopeptide (TPR) repeat protein
MNTGQTAPGLKVAEDAFDLAIEWSSYERKDKLSKILSMIAQGAGAKRALELSGRLPDLNDRVACELMAMWALAASDELDQAKELGRAAVISVASALNPYSDGRLLEDAVVTLYDAGILEEAESAVKSLNKPSERAIAFASIARCLYRRGRSEEAGRWIKQASTEAESGDYELGVLVRIAETAIDIGGLEGILLPANTERAAGVLRRLVSHYAREKAFEKAIDLAARLPDAERADALDEIASALRKDKQTERGLEIANEALMWSGGGLPPASATATLVAAGELPALVEVCRAIEGPRQRALAFAKLADECKRQRRADEARTAAREARKSLELPGVHPLSRNLDAFVATATALNASGDAQGVFDLLRLFENDPAGQSLINRLRALFGKPPPRPSSPFPERAAEIVRSLPTAWIRQLVVSPVVTALAIRGETTLALNLARERADWGCRAWDLAATAAMLRPGEAQNAFVREALSVARGLAIGQQRAAALMAIVPMVVETAEIIEVIRQIAESDPSSLPRTLERLKPVLQGREAAQSTAIVRACRQIAEQLEAEYHRNSALSAVNGLTAAVAPNIAIEWAHSVEDPGIKLRALTEIVVNANTKDALGAVAREACELAAAIDNQYIRSDAFARIIAPYAAHGTSDEIAELGRARTKPRDRAQILTIAMETAGQRGMVQTVRTLGPEALAAAVSVEDRYTRQSTVNAVVKAVASAGPIDEVLALSRTLPADLRSNALLEVLKAAASHPRIMEIAREGASAAREGDKDYMRRIIQTLASAGRPDLAIELAKANTDLTALSPALAECAAASWKAGHAELALAQARQAIAAASEIKNDAKRSETLAGAVEPFISEPDRAIELAMEIPAGSGRDRTLALLSDKFTSSGRVQLGLDLAGKLGSVAGQVEALAAAIRRCAEAGFFRQIRPLAVRAFDLLTFLSDESPRGDAVNTLLRALLDLHLDRLAHELAAAIPYATARARTLGALAVLWSKGRHFPEALTLVRSIEQQPEADDALGKITTILIARGQRAEASELARAIKKSSNSRSWILTNVSDAMVQDGEYAAAADLAREAPDASAALAHVCAAMIKAKEIVGAWELAQSIENVVRRAEALALVARALGRSGQAERTEKALDEARAAAEKLSPDDFGRASARIAAVWAELGRYQQAREAAKHCYLPSEKLWAYTAIVRADLARRRPEWAQPMAEVLTVQI